MNRITLQENSLLSIDVTQMKLGFKFTRNRVNCTDIISYTEKNELNSRTGSNFASREGLILFCNNVQSFQGNSLAYVTNFIQQYDKARCHYSQREEPFYAMSYPHYSSSSFLRPIHMIIFR